MYGKEGKKTNYSPYGCNRIILGQVPLSGDHSGCPFRHFDQVNIKKTIKSNNKNIKESEINEITDLLKGQHYQVYLKIFKNRLLVESILKLNMLVN
jgi:DNA primase large subunit